MFNLFWLFHCFDSWTNVFEDIESGIDYYMWGVGSQAGQDDVIPFVVTAQQCGVGFEDNNLFLREGHAYFITVKVCTLNVLIVKWSRFMLLCTCVQEKDGGGQHLVFVIFPFLNHDILNQMTQKWKLYFARIRKYNKNYRINHTEMILFSDCSIDTKIKSYLYDIRILLNISCRF